MSTKPLTAVDPESNFAVEIFAQDLLNDFFIDDENSLVGKLTKLPATDNRQAVCQWLLQLWPWLSYREPTETERRQLINDFGNTVRFIFL